MNRVLPPLALTLLVASAAGAQEPAPVYQPEREYSFKLRVDGLLRQEWSDEIFLVEGSRARARLLPRVEMSFKKLRVDVGGDFAYGSDDNTLPPPSVPALPLLRDNYKSRDARLDLAFASLKPTGWLRVEGGRFEMPVGLTELIWDRDLRPQGGAVSLEKSDLGSVKHASLTLLGARGSHVFDDDHSNMFLGAASASFEPGAPYRLEVQAAFITWTGIATIEPIIRRQNTRVGGRLVGDYRVLDVVARLRREGRLATQLVADYCRNTAADDKNQGLWLALVLGSTKTSRARGEYTYAFVDADATLAAYTTGDFIWATGWEGHRLDIGVRAADHVTLHGVGQVQRFKDSPRVEDRDEWIKRLRLELRLSWGG